MATNFCNQMKTFTQSGRWYWCTQVLGLSICESEFWVGSLSKGKDDRSILLKSLLLSLLNAKNRATERVDLALHLKHFSS